MITTNFAYFIQNLPPFAYFTVTLSNQPLNQLNILSIQLAFSWCEGLNNNVQSAGVNDNATKADMITDMAMVMANCWYKRPTIPGIKPTGTNTEARMSAIAITGA